MKPEPSILFPPFRLDVVNERLEHGSQTIALRPKTFAVLRYLLGRSGQLVTKEELLDAVWPDTRVSDAGLKDYVQEIRKALGDDARTPRFVETVHRRGYRFIGKVVSDQLSVVSQTEVASRQEQPQVQDLESGIQIQEESEDEGEKLVSLSPKSQALDLWGEHWQRGALAVVGLLLLMMAATGIRKLFPHSSLSSSVPAEEMLALPLPDTPSIVVLPLVNLSDDPQQEYFSDGLTEDLTSTLSRVPGLFVIARNSAFTYKGKAVRVQEISKELGVRYVLEGSVRKADGQVRVATQLIDAITGYQLWTEHYDRPLQDIFALQDEIVQKIVTTLELQLTLSEQGFQLRKRTDSLEAYDYFLRGVEIFWGLTKEANIQARQMLEKAIKLDPNYALAYVALGSTYYTEYTWQWSQDPQTLERAFELAQKAVALDDSLPEAHGLLGWVYMKRQQPEQAIVEGERAITVDPNNANGYARLAEVLTYTGRPEEAVGLMKKAMRLNPRYPVWYLFTLGAAYRLTGQFAEAVAAQRQVLSRSPNFFFAYTELAFSYLWQWSFQLSDDPQNLEQALAAAQRAITLNDSALWTHATLGYVYLVQKQYEQAVAEMEGAVALARNSANDYAILAEMLSYAGRPEEAIELAEKATRLSSPQVGEPFFSLGCAYHLAGRFEEAVAPLERFVLRHPQDRLGHLHLAAVYSELGREKEAQAEVAELLRLCPGYSLEVMRQRWPYKDPVMLERHLAALRKAGLK